MTRTLAIVLEGVGILVVVSGITVECLLHADIGYVLITGGSLTVAAGAFVFAKFYKWSK